jgi:hypothetical protein
MKRYITHQFPNELKTYALLTLASVLTVVAVTFFFIAMLVPSQEIY